MKRYLYLIIITIVVSAGCTSPSAQPEKVPAKENIAHVASDSELPVCQVERIESCEIEAVLPTETVFRCEHCGKSCTDCQGDECKECPERPCRCRQLNPENKKP